MQAATVTMFAVPLKGYLKTKTGKSNLCFTQGGKANEKIGFIAGGMRCGNYIKTDISICIKLLLQQIIIVILLRD